MSSATRQGWLEVSGTGLFSSWKRVYAVMDGTKLTYYTDSAQQAPFGTDKQGEIDVAEPGTEVTLSSDKLTVSISNRSSQKKFRAENARSAGLWYALAKDVHALRVLAASASCMRDEGYKFDLTEVEEHHVIVAVFRLTTIAGTMTLALSVQSGCAIVTTKGIPTCPEAYRRELLEAVTRANYGMRVGGFNMDFRDGEIRFQTEIPLLNIDPRHFKSLIRPLIGINLRTHERYYNGFNEIKEGRKTGRQAIEDIEGPGSTGGGGSTGGSGNNPTGNAALQVIARQVFDSQNFNYTESPGQIIARKNLPAGQELLVKVSFGPVVIVLSSYFRTNEEHVRPALVEAITRANWGMRIGQFIMDPRDGEVMYQSEVALPDLNRQGVDALAHLLIPIMMANIQTHERYIPAFQSIRTGTRSPAEAIADVEGGEAASALAAAAAAAGGNPAVADRLAELMRTLGGGGGGTTGTTQPPGPAPTAGPVSDHDYRDILLEVSGFSRVTQKLGPNVYQAVFAAGPVVVKIVTLDPRNREAFLDEMRLQMRIHHPHIVGIQGVAYARVQERGMDNYEIVEDRNSLAIVQQCCPNGSLANWLRGVVDGRVQYNEFLAVRLMEETAQGLAMLHAKGIIHQDLKAENILINSDQRALVGDFGLQSHIISVAGATAPSSPKDTAALMQRHEANTLIYVDPATIESGVLTRAADVYAFGILLHHIFVTRSLVDVLTLQDEELRSAAVPGRSARYVEMLKDKYRAGLRPALQVPNSFVDSLSAPVRAAMSSLIPACLDKTPANRPQFEDICVILNRLREYLESIGANRISTSSHAAAVLSTSATIRGPVSEPPPDLLPVPAPPAAFQLLPTVEAIKNGLGIDPATKLDESLRVAAEILGITDEVTALRTAREKAIRIKDEMGL